MIKHKSYGDFLIDKFLHNPPAFLFIEDKDCFGDPRELFLLPDAFLFKEIDFFPVRPHLQNSHNYASCLVKPADFYFKTEDGQKIYYANSCNPRLTYAYKRIWIDSKDHSSSFEFGTRSVLVCLQNFENLSISLFRKVF